VATTSRIRPKSVTAALLASAIVVALPGLAGAAALPDLKVTRVVAPASAEAGDTIPVEIRIKNVGDARAGSSVARVFLSKDRVKSKDDVRIGRVWVPRLRPGASVTRTIDATLPETIAPRMWAVIGCADATKVVREKREDNNCRAAKEKIEVLSSSPAIPECSDGIDNDGDGKIDFHPTPGMGDPECTSPDDNSESS
jgi:hypothetical protein